MQLFSGVQLPLILIRAIGLGMFSIASNKFFVMSFATVKHILNAQILKENILLSAAVLVTLERTQQLHGNIFYADLSWSESVTIAIIMSISLKLLPTSKLLFIVCL